MGRLSREKAQKLYNATVQLLKYTTWRCGRVERVIINYLRLKMLRHGSPATVREILQVSPVRRKTFDALRRLQTRRIIRIGGSE